MEPSTTCGPIPGCLILTHTQVGFLSGKERRQIFQDVRFHVDWWEGTRCCCTEMYTNLPLCLLPNARENGGLSSSCLSPASKLEVHSHILIPLQHQASKLTFKFQNLTTKGDAATREAKGEGTPLMFKMTQVVLDGRGFLWMFKILLVGLNLNLQRHA